MTNEFLQISLDEEKFPLRLKEIPDPPAILYYRGVPPMSAPPHIAIVGTRKATAAGKEIAHRLAKDLAAAGAVIISGLAIGIDTAAHQGALAAGGRTVAVLANGLDNIYPTQNTRLAEEIIKNGGTIISEYAPGTPPYKTNFLARNRLVSGLSLGVIVVEAPFKSGALSTASHALEQNRDVFVVPGPINQENYAGAHSLLRAGARLITSAAEVLDDLNLAPAPAAQPVDPPTGLDEKQKSIFGVLKKAGEPISIDKIHNLTKMDVSAISRNLTMLLVRGMVKEEGGRYYL